MKKLISLLLIALTITPAYAGNTSDRVIYADEVNGVYAPKNLSRDFRKAGAYTASGGSLSVSGGTLTFDASAADQTVTMAAVAIPDDFQGNDGVLSCPIKCASGSCTHKLQIYDGTNVLVEKTITSSTSQYVTTSMNRPFPGSGNIQWRLISVASNEPSVSVKPCFFGKAEGFNLQNITGMKLVGTISWAGTASCQWTTTSSTLANFSADTDCPAPTVTGALSAPSTKIPAFVMDTDTSNYLIVATGAFRQTGTNTVGFAFGDGTVSTKLNSVMLANQSIGTITGSYTPSSAGTKTVNIMGLAESSSTANIYSDAASRELSISVYKSESALGYKPDQTSWRVDANISGTEPSLGSSSVSSYTGIESTGLTLTNNSGNGVVTAQIPCSSTNAPTGTTCSTGSESVGVSFLIPRAEDVLACANFGHYIDLGTGGTIDATFQIVETAKDAQTILQEGKSRVSSRNGNAGTNLTFPHRICGTFTFASVGQKTLRLMYEQIAAGTINSNLIKSDASASGGQRDIHWEVYPLGTLFGAPILTGSVTSNTSGQERVERATISTTDCSISKQSGSWLTGTGTHNGSGDCSMTISDSEFSDTPTCVCSYGAGTPSTQLSCAVSIAAESSTSLRVITNNGGSNANGTAKVICMGPR